MSSWQGGTGGQGGQGGQGRWETRGYGAGDRRARRRREAAAHARASASLAEVQAIRENFEEVVQRFEVSTQLMNSLQDHLVTDTGRWQRECEDLQERDAEQAAFVQFLTEEAHVQQAAEERAAHALATTESQVLELRHARALRARPIGMSLRRVWVMDEQTRQLRAELAVMEARLAAEYSEL